MPLRNVATNYTFEQQRQEINLLAADVDSLSTTLTNQQATETTDSPSFNNLYLGSVIYGPSIFTIDPATHGDDTGTLVVKGNLQIDGTTTTVNSTTMSVNDLNITLAMVLLMQQQQMVLVLLLMVLVQLFFIMDLQMSGRLIKVLLHCL